MTCQERQDQLLMLAFGQLDAKEEQEMREHLAGGCPVCAGAMAEAEALAGMVPLALKPETPDANLKKRLMTEIQEEEQQAAMKMPAAKKSSWVKPVAIAATIAIVATGMLAYIGPIRHLQAKNVALNNELGDAKHKVDDAEGHAKAAEEQANEARADSKSANERASDAVAQMNSVRDQLAAANDHLTKAAADAVAQKDALEKTRNELAAARSQNSDVQTRLTTYDQQIKEMNSTIDGLKDKIQKAQVNTDFVRSPGLQLVDLHSDTQPAASAHILYDPATSRWLLVANGLRNPGPGKTYELWIITDKPFPAGTFNVDENGQGTLVASVPADAHITQAAVTDEPAGGTKAPTGTMQLKGNVQRG